MATPRRIKVKAHPRVQGGRQVQVRPFTRTKPGAKRKSGLARPKKPLL